ncbi:hypothetical protein EVAR_98509_1 [Eumeta japonica]|uniref:Uncharacterized protein n=1 Tax=Eumeta variegata TaxID=151549 RepID=A0A4C2AE17_EUMVA|nr:hypothetical protein EVAR_98509_1 [Eumeta japonica]
MPPALSMAEQQMTLKTVKRNNEDPSMCLVCKKPRHRVTDANVEILDEFSSSMNKQKERKKPILKGQPKCHYRMDLAHSNVENIN